MRVRVGVLTASFGLLACTAACGPSVPAAPELAHGAPSAKALPHAHLLLNPESDGVGLLGRAVFPTDDGTWSIAHGRAAGCEVRVRREPSSFHARREVSLLSMTAVGMGYADLVELHAKHGSSLVARIEIENTEVLEADVRGDCGEYVVDRVWVGHGQRRLVVGSEIDAGGGVSVGPLTPSGEHRQSEEIVDAMSWDTAQAYGFSFRQTGDLRPLDLDVDVQGTVIEGAEVRVGFETTEPTYLIVLAVTERGEATVLWPSPEEPEPFVTPTSGATLPSAKERAAGYSLRAAVAEPGKAARETLIVYAVTDLSSFRRIIETAVASNRDPKSLASDLARALEDVPIRRWTRVVRQYVIEPLPVKE